MSPREFQAAVCTLAEANQQPYVLIIKLDADGHTGVSHTFDDVKSLIQLLRDAADDYEKGLHRPSPPLPDVRIGVLTVDQPAGQSLAGRRDAL